MHIAIIANGEIKDYMATKNKLQEAAFVIACDGGLRHADVMDVLPGVIIGDLDSAPSSYLSYCKSKGVPIHVYPAQKDDTDLALSMLYALEKCPSSIVIVGALGGRVDHQLANFHVLAMAKDIPAEIWDDGISVQIVNDRICLPKEDYQIVSLIPLSTEVTGITTQGLVYPLNGEALSLGIVRGVSNCFSAEEVIVTIESGTLLVMRCRETSY